MKTYFEVSNSVSQTLNRDDTFVNFFVSISVTIWNGFNWVLIGNRGGPLETRERATWFYNKEVIRPAEGLAMAHAGGCRV